MIADGERRIELFRPPTQVNKASQTSQACEESSQTSETSQSSESSQASKFSMVNWRYMELMNRGCWKQFFISPDSLFVLTS